MIGARGVRSSARLILWSWGKVTCRQRQHERPARPAQAPAIAERGTHDVQRWNTRSPATRAVQLTAAEYCACCRAVLAAILAHQNCLAVGRSNAANEQKLPSRAVTQAQRHGPWEAGCDASSGHAPLWWASGAAHAASEGRVSDDIAGASRDRRQR